MDDVNTVSQCMQNIPDFGPSLKIMEEMKKYPRASFMLILCMSCSATSPYLLLEVQVILPLPSPRQVQSTIIQP